MPGEQVAHEEIMDGVYEALCDHGYADLTMQDIANECGKSTSLLHYHYDTKADLLVAFLDHILTDYKERIGNRPDRSPVEQLCAFIAWFVFGPGDEERESFHLALLEMRSRGPFDDRIREQLDRSDRLLRTTVADSLEAGIEAGLFEPVDIDRTAAMIVATLDGARTRQTTLGEDPPGSDTYTRTVADAALERVVDPLLADGVERPTLAETLADMPDWTDR
ncbi:MAG: TetR/AcrR family transcriptional regulator [Halovenus sp.]